MSSLPEVDRQSTQIFRISPLIRITLLLLYVALTLPLPFLANFSHSDIPIPILVTGLGLGFLIIYGALSQRVVLDPQCISVGYPIWAALFIGKFDKGWVLPWAEVKGLKPRTTGQGGLVYYFLSQSGAGFLLPMRVAGFARLVARVEAETGIDTTDIRPLAQPWMYLILFVLSLFLMLTDAWTISTAISGINID
jgi:hypothetical protein